MDGCRWGDDDDDGDEDRTMSILLGDKVGANEWNDEDYWVECAVWC